MNRIIYYGLYSLIPIIIIMDQWSKWLIINEPRLDAMRCLERLVPCGRIEISSVFDLSMVWNRGISFGVGQSEGVMRWVLIIATLAITAAFIIWLSRTMRYITALALAMIIGGAIGNVIDRIRFGAVIDFLDFSGIKFIWAFNIADAAISVGAALLFADQFFLSRDDQLAKSGQDTNDRELE